MEYLHPEIEVKQSSKHNGDPCGDFFRYERDEFSTTLVLSDGLGHGIKAHIAAVMTVSRMFELISGGISHHEAFYKLVNTMDSSWGSELPFAVFTLVRILNNGQVTILSYEMPLPIIISRRMNASIVSGRNYTVGKGIVTECNYFLENGESIVLMSDGVTQSGIGKLYPYGWDSKGVSDYISKGIKPSELASKIHDKSIVNWGENKGDDVTCVSVTMRKGDVVNILTGAPLSKSSDEKFVYDFMRLSGYKIICGGTTAKIYSRITGKKLEVDNMTTSFLTPPKSHIEGIDLTTEGAVTLNQVYNIYEEDVYPKGSPVSGICMLMKNCDRINILEGNAENEAMSDITFKQQGILHRNKVLPLIIEKLKKDGKLVVIHNY